MHIGANGLQNHISLKFEIICCIFTSGCERRIFCAKVKRV